MRSKSNRIVSHEEKFKELNIFSLKTRFHCHIIALFKIWRANIQSLNKTSMVILKKKNSLFFIFYFYGVELYKLVKVTGKWLLKPKKKQNNKHKFSDINVSEIVTNFLTEKCSALVPGVLKAETGGWASQRRVLEGRSLSWAKCFVAEIATCLSNVNTFSLFSPKNREPWFHRRQQYPQSKT